MGGNWDVDETIVAPFQGCEDTLVRRISWSPDGQFLVATNSKDGVSPPLCCRDISYICFTFSLSSLLYHARKNRTAGKKSVRYSYTIYISMVKRISFLARLTRRGRRGGGLANPYDCMIRFALAPLEIQRKISAYARHHS